MDKMITEILPYAVAVALSPMPIAALILMLLSKRAKINSVMFTAGWIAGLAILVLVVTFLVGESARTVKHDTGFDPKTIIDLVLGLVLIGFALKEWKSRSKAGKTPQMPKWMRAVEKFSPIKALIIGFLLATLNLKNTPMGITVGAAISDFAHTSAQQTAGVIIYLVLASCTITIPVIGFLLLGKRLQKTLETLKVWLIGNNATIMFVLFLILGIVLISKAFGG